MVDHEQNDGGLCARNRCNFVILALGLALVAAPAPMGYSAHATAATASMAAGLAMWVCSLAAMLGLGRIALAACAFCGLTTAAAPWMLGFESVQNAAFVHGAAGSATAAVSLAALIMSTARASIPVRA
ncbi:MAG: hypothetical protein KF904_21300 [Rhodoblastus sp.]|nr:hypothetical protein [Rhodoblastus sp.]